MIGQRGETPDIERGTCTVRCRMLGLVAGARG
jgi:hypothetical protein